MAVIASVCLLALPACSLNDLSVRMSSVFIDYKIDSLNSEDDLKKVKQQLPENIELLEQMLALDAQNKKLHIYAAQAYYSYAFAFIEDSNKQRATTLYFKSYQHAAAALAMHNVLVADLQGRSPALRKKTRRLKKDAVDALYWTAVSWAKLIEIKQPDLLMFSQLHKTAILMEQVIKLDESYQLGGPHLFFGVYYGGRSSFLGGNDRLAGQYFEQARELNQDRLLLVDYLQAKYLNGRVNGGKKYTQRLRNIVKAPNDLYPEQALMNAVVKHKASLLLSRSQF